MTAIKGKAVLYKGTRVRLTAAGYRQFGRFPRPVNAKTGSMQRQWTGVVMREPQDPSRHVCVLLSRPWREMAPGMRRTGGRLIRRLFRDAEFRPIMTSRKTFNESMEYINAH